MCAMKVKDRYTLTIDHNLASIDHSQQDKRFQMTDYHFNCVKNIIQHELIRLYIPLEVPIRVIEFKRLTVISHL